MTSPIAVGSIIVDTYRITSLLGEGGMGTVWEAEHLRLPGKRLAVKVLHTTLTSGEVLLRFRREAEIASRIGHPNIVEVTDFNALPGGEPFLVMELLSGESLSARLKRGRLEERAALDIARQIGSALNAAHAMNVVHRDLKPDNVFLCPRDVDGELRDHVKVLDFGISKIRNSQTVLTQDSAIMGTPYYMSPEQASGKNQEIDGRTDIFALGAIVFEMLTGTTAFPGDSLPAVIYQVVFEPHPSLAKQMPTLNPRIVAAVDRALAKKPEERFQDMVSFIEALTGRPLMTMANLKAEAAARVSGQQPAATSSRPGGATPSGLDATAASLPPGPGITPAVAVAPTTVLPAGRPVPATAIVSAQRPSVVTVPPVERPRPIKPKAEEKKRGMWGYFLAVALVIVVPIAIILVLRGTGQWPLQAKKDAEVVTPSTETKTDVQVIAGAKEDAGKVMVADTAPAKTVDAKPVGTKGDKTPHPKGDTKVETLPPAVAAKLDDAEKALSAKNVADAIRLARQSMYDKKTARASSILTRAYCIKGDLGAAKAELQHVSGAERTRVLKACRAVGMEL
jgi:tRNA A-37 threonylcarbamoyl transferase component Bud32